MDSHLFYYCNYSGNFWIHRYPRRKRINNGNNLPHLNCGYNINYDIEINNLRGKIIDNRFKNWT
jgi:hypothetical protein